MFAESVIDDMFTIANMFGPEAATFLSNDNKARIPLGLADSILQTPILMHLEYKVALPNHSFVVAPTHKLIESVYGICEIISEGQVFYSGDRFVRIRSAKHDTSNAFTHAHDLIELFKCRDIPQKPILLTETDGAQDEAPWCSKPIYTALYLFKELKLNALIHGVNAAGFSGFNLVEKRMASLSHDLAGVILPYDQFGLHLDIDSLTVDTEFEMQNFLSATETLATIWSSTVIDGHKVDARAMALDQKFEAPISEPKWVAEHVQQLRDALQSFK